MEKTLKKDTKEQNQEKEEITAEEDVSLDIEENDSIEVPEEISQEEIIKDLEDQLLRAKAEVQNVRRIAAQEVTKARLFGVESLAKDFLSVADNLERAIESCGEEEQFLSIKEGLELTLKSLEGSLNSSSIEVIDTSSKDFDPEKHEAISLIEDDSLDTNTIIDVVQKGYTIMDRTLRPSKVVVSKKSQEKS
jgi:molecular chaperone GrpE